MKWKNVNKVQEQLRKASPTKMLDGLKKLSRKVSATFLYSCLLLFYAFKRKDTPGWAKRNILGAMAYALAPLDAVPDLTPFFGFQDDIGVLSFCIVSIACYINQEVRNDARAKLEQWLGEVPESALASVDNKL